MENSKKIKQFHWAVFALLLFLFVFYLKQPTKGVIQIKNHHILYQDSTGKLTFKITMRYDATRTYTTTTVSAKQKEVPLQEGLDASTFDLLSHFKEDSLKIQNRYYTLNPSLNYYKDKKNLYFLRFRRKVNAFRADTLSNPVYIGSDSAKYLVPILMKMGTIQEYEALGGHYLRVRNKIYFNASEIPFADASSFHVVHVLGEKTEWLWAIGLDIKNIYSGSKLMDSTEFEATPFLIDKDSLRKRYFK